MPTLAVANSDELKSRFDKALSLSDDGETAEAVSLYRQLIEDYPKAPELYNNLAILLVKQNQPEQAVKVLEQGLRSHPGYAALYDNLIELNLNLSRQNYMKALVPIREQGAELASQRSTSDLAELYYDRNQADKLAQAEAALEKASRALNQAEARARDAVQSRERAEANVKAEREARANAEDRARQESEARAEAETRLRIELDARRLAQDEAREASLAREQAEAQLRELNQQISRAKAQIEQLKLAKNETGTVDEVPPVMNLEDKARAAINAWAEAWMGQDVQGYVDAYVDGYAPPGKSHRQWVDDRKVRLTRPAYIRIDLSEFEFFIIDSTHIAVQFKQKYSRKNYSDREHKEVLLVLEDGRWKIEKEKRL
ncbi:MAG: tetratricopeptide repeat protein [Gammaproteobacteria bacterium]|nr:tetratricopeptide repeat protein [Gammaproteobacteria bacterium]